MDKDLHSFDKFMYCSLVSSKTDLLGKLAYSYYQEDKLSFINEFHKSRSKYPTKKELDIYNLSVKDDIEKFQKLAADELAAFVSVAIEKENERAEAAKKREAAEAQEKKKGFFGDLFSKK